MAMNGGGEIVSILLYAFVYSWIFVLTVAFPEVCKQTCQHLVFNSLEIIYRHLSADLLFLRHVNIPLHISKYSFNLFSYIIFGFTDVIMLHILKPWLNVTRIYMFIPYWYYFYYDYDSRFLFPFVNFSITLEYVCAKQESTYVNRYLTLLFLITQ